MACAPTPKRFQIPYDGEIVYYLHVEETNLIKIGTTCQWERRVQGLLPQYGTFSLIATERGYRQREREVHQLFWRERVNRHAELFEPSPILMRHIADLNDGEDPITYEFDIAAHRAQWSSLSDWTPPRST
jgi:T5orf172 domain